MTFGFNKRRINCMQKHIFTNNNKKTKKSSTTNMITILVWFSNILTLSVPDEDYSRNASCAKFDINVFIICLQLIIIVGDIPVHKLPYGP
jgi:cytosine/uracil/thiamine/allantoin permease